MSAPPFWLVWHENGGNPHYRHPTLAEAEQEAERLARKYSGSRFYVLVPTLAVRHSDVERERFDVTDMEIPF